MTKPETILPHGRDTATRQGTENTNETNAEICIRKHNTHKYTHKYVLVHTSTGIVFHSNIQNHFHSLWANTKFAARHQTVHTKVNRDTSKKL